MAPSATNSMLKTAALNKGAIDCTEHKSASSAYHGKTKNRENKKKGKKRLKVGKNGVKAATYL